MTCFQFIEKHGYRAYATISGEVVKSEIRDERQRKADQKIAKKQKAAEKKHAKALNEEHRKSLVARRDDLMKERSKIDAALKDIRGKIKALKNPTEETDAEN